MQFNLPTNTWRYKIGLACWDLEVMHPKFISGDSDKQTLLRTSVSSILSSLGDFAKLGNLSITTSSIGEDAAQFKPDASEESLENFLLNYHDILEVEADLDLSLVGNDGIENWLKGGVTLWFQLEDETDRSSPLRLLVSLNVDIYFSKTSGEIKDNHALSSKNAPRLNHFLTRLTKEKAKIIDIDAPGYSNQIDQKGLIKPA
ncbi:hypothetical protein ONV78_25780 [Hahella sp. CR1]|uniref:hypothetical protein n=1 Tax=Hahella sp. CR1 TaxID=2992807 RepID=UPI0024410304|nr:hypothetical protein [Hahella sp. CR1]MDG9671178.1 hypothetical protein [Hahella sp. CR1]